MIWHYKIVNVLVIFFAFWGKASLEEKQAKNTPKKLCVFVVFRHQDPFDILGPKIAPFLGKNADLTNGTCFMRPQGVGAHGAWGPVQGGFKGIPERGGLQGSGGGGGGGSEESFGLVRRVPSGGAICYRLAPAKFRTLQILG